jgi:hypothetical protein
VQTSDEQTLHEGTAREQTILNVFGRLNLADEPYNNLNQWTDGFTFYSPYFTDMWVVHAALPRADGDTIYFVGGTLHEGGYTIAALLADDGTMKIANDDYKFTKGDAVEYRTIGGATLLIIKDVRTGNAKDVLMQINGDFRDLLTGNFKRYLLAGRFVHVGSYLRSADKYIQDDGNIDIVVFAPDKPEVVGFINSGKTPYTFVDEYETPVPILRFGNNDVYKITKTLIGLELVPMKIENDGWEEIFTVDESKPVIQLNKTAEMLPGLPAGRFPLASVEVMSVEKIQQYAGIPTLPNLQVMRNEIFARYGYKFRSGGDMDAYFRTQDWYVPKFDDVTSKLTEIERLNIELIQALEKKIRDDAY